MQMNRESPKGLVTELRGRNGVTEMKVKHFLSGATLLSAALLLNAPLSAAVEAVESDVVGYTTTQLTSKFTLVGINFSSLSGKNTIPINEVITGDFANGDQLQIQDGDGGYIVLEWKEDGWYGLSASTPASVEVTRGTGVWIVAQSASTNNPVKAQLKGAVNLSDEMTSEFGQRYVIASTGLPVDTGVNSPLFKWTNLADKDQLQIPDGTGGYVVLEWRDADGDGQYHWYGLSASTPATVLIPKESAFWIVSSNELASVTISPKEL